MIKAIQQKSVNANSLPLLTILFDKYMYVLTNIELTKGKPNKADSELKKLLSCWHDKDTIFRQFGELNFENYFFMPEELTDVIPLCPNPRIKITDHKIAYAFTAFGMKDDWDGKDSNIIQKEG